MDGIDMIEGLSPQEFSPTIGEFLSELLMGESQSFRGTIGIDKLQISQLVEEDIIKHETTNSELGPFLTSVGAELLRRLLASHRKPQREAFGQREEGNFRSPPRHVTQSALAHAHVIELNRAKPLPKRFWQP